MSYVGYTSIPAGENDKNLWQLLARYTHPEDYFFLRSLHQVSGIITELPAKLSPEGQLFNPTLELRWKKRQQSYEILWLGLESPDDAETFTAIERQWQTEDHPASLHDRKTPQYPNLFKYPCELKDQIQQRYFRDAKTNIVHFVALTLHKAESSKSSPTQA